MRYERSYKSLQQFYIYACCSSITLHFAITFRRSVLKSEEQNLQVREEVTNQFHFLSLLVHKKCHLGEEREKEKKITFNNNNKKSTLKLWSDVIFQINLEVLKRFKTFSSLPHNADISLRLL